MHVDLGIKFLLLTLNLKNSNFLSHFIKPLHTKFCAEAWKDSRIFTRTCKYLHAEAEAAKLIDQICNLI